MLPDGAAAIAGKMGEDTTVSFDKAGVYGIRCKPHYGMGMVAMVVVGAPGNADQAKGVATRERPSRVSRRCSKSSQRRRRQETDSLEPAAQAGASVPFRYDPMSPIPRLREYNGPDVLSYGFRPFFLLGSIFAGRRSSSGCRPISARSQSQPRLRHGTGMRTR